MANLYEMGGIVFDGLTANTTLTSSWFRVSHASTLGLHFYSASNTRAGTITIQGSAQPGIPSSLTSAAAVNLAFQRYSTGAVATSLTVTNGAATAELLGLPFYEFPWIRCVFTDSTGGTGAGTLSGWMWMKDYGPRR